MQRAARYIAERSNMDDNRIIDLLFERSENALEEIKKKYSRLYGYVIRNAVDNESDAEECENDLLLSVWNSIPPARPDNLSAYICRIARRIGIDRLRYNTRSKRNGDLTVMLSELEECLPDRAMTSGERGSEIGEILSEFVRELEPVTRILFIRRYVYLETVAGLSGRFEMSENNVAAKLYRARKKLKKKLNKEGINV